LRGTSKATKQLIFPKFSFLTRKRAATWIRGIWS